MREKPKPRVWGLGLGLRPALPVTHLADEDPDQPESSRRKHEAYVEDESEQSVWLLHCDVP